MATGGKNMCLFCFVYAKTKDLKREEEPMLLCSRKYYCPVHMGTLAFPLFGSSVFVYKSKMQQKNLVNSQIKQMYTNYSNTQFCANCPYSAPVGCLFSFCCCWGMDHCLESMSCMLLDKVWLVEKLWFSFSEIGQHPLVIRNWQVKLWVEPTAWWKSAKCEEIPNRRLEW